MKKAKTNRDEVRENSFTVLALKNEKISYKKQASKMGLSLSAWVRMVLNENIDGGKG